MGQKHVIFFAVILGIAVILGGIQSDSSINSSIRLGKDISTDNQKACFENIREIQNAVKRYNSSFWTYKGLVNFDDNSRKMLIEKNYLSSTMSLPTEKCEYASEGDLSHEGILYCKFHGDLDNKLNLWNKSKAKEDSRKHTNWLLIAFCVSLGFYLFVNIGAWLLRLLLCLIVNIIKSWLF